MESGVTSIHSNDDPPLQKKITRGIYLDYIAARIVRPDANGAESSKCVIIGAALEIRKKDSRALVISGATP